MTLVDLIVLLKRGWIAILASMLAALAIALVYLVLAPREYQSSAVLLVSVPGASTIQEAADAVDLSQAAAQTYVPVIQSTSVLSSATSRAGDDTSIGELASSLTVSTRNGTAIIDLSSTASSASLASKQTAAVAEAAESVIPRLNRASGLSPLEISTISPASVSSDPISPKIASTIAIALAIGALIGTVLVVLRSQLKPFGTSKHLN